MHKKMGRAFCSRPVASILPAWGFQKLSACCPHIYIPHSRTSACGSLALARLTTLTGDLRLAPLGCPRFSHRGGGLFRIPRAPWISGWERPAGCIDASHSAGVAPLPLGGADGLHLYTADWAAALATRWRWWGTFRLRGREGQVNRPRGFGSLLPPLCLYYSTRGLSCQAPF